MKATRFTVLACLAAVTSCACNAPASRREAEAAMTVRQKFAAFNRHDASAIQSIYGANAALHSPDYPDLRGNVPIARTYRQLFAAIPDARDEIVSFDATGDKVYVQFFLTGHWEGISTKSLHVRIMSVYVVGDDHIVDDTTYYDRKVR
jgi:ketosteroid isomerase-like protein